jgi:hypothetical protein
VNKNDNRVLLLFIEIYDCNSYTFDLIFTVLNIPTTPKGGETERRSRLRVKTERKFYRPGDGVDGKSGLTIRHLQVKRRLMFLLTMHQLPIYHLLWKNQGTKGVR